MQQRFCECGKMIQVRYVLDAEGLQIIFEKRHEKEKSALVLCPSCGRNLTIDELR
jgi:hypothetical protein